MTAPLRTKIIRPASRADSSSVRASLPAARPPSPAREEGRGPAMPGRSAVERRALEAVERAVMGVFEAAGFDHIAPDIVQPADIFLDSSGEEIRARTYVFTDPAGAELCLRPDLT